MIKNILILLIISFSYQISYTQKNDVEIIEFSDDDDDLNDNFDPMSVIILKTNPLSNIFGRQFVEVEKPILDYLSLQAGLGITFKPVVVGFNNIYSQLYDDLLTDNQTSTNWDPTLDVYDDYNDYTYRNTRLGFYGSLTGKLYFYSDAPDDAYISFTTRFSTNNYNIQKIQANEFQEIRLADDLQNESVQNFDFVVRYGYQTLFSKLATESFVGIGVSNKRQKRQDLGYDANGLQNAEQRFTSQNLILEFGLRVGIQIETPEPSSKKKKKKKKRRRK